MGDKIVIVGFGWTGQANALALSMMGHSVYYCDIRRPPLHYVQRYARVYEQVPAIPNPRTQDSDRTFYVICVGDKVSTDGDQDITDIKLVLDELKGARGRVILRSSVLPDRLHDLAFHYYVPEFLRVGSAVEDALNPSWMVIGSNCGDELPPFLEMWIARARKLFIGSPDEAAFIKYLSNTWNAARVAFVNEFGSVVGNGSIVKNLDKINRVVDFVFERNAYLRYGNAYSGQCLPKDARAFLKWCNNGGHVMAVLDGVCAGNAHHALRPEHVLLPEWLSDGNAPGPSVLDAATGSDRAEPACHKISDRVIDPGEAGFRKPAPAGALHMRPIGRRRHASR